MSNITFQREGVAEAMEEMKILLNLHYKEIGLYNDKIELNICWDTYLALESVGSVHLITVRDDGELIGYYASIIQPHLHYGSDLFAVNDVLFIHPNYRKGFTAIRLIKEAERQMRERGVTVMTVHFKTYAPFDKLLARLGWDYSERLYTKYLGDR